jgi:hypothetical protein
MPKVQASMADVSTEFVLPEPGIKTFKVEECKEQVAENPRRISYNFKNVIQTPGDDFKKPVFHTVHLHKKTGETNEYGVATIKRYFEAIAPDSANSEDADTDELLNGLFDAEVVHETYKSEKHKDSEGKPKEMKRAALNDRTISPVA